MANTKKYVSLDKLGLYDEKIKKWIGDADTTSLNSAKSYADSLATNYDAAGSAAAVDAKLTTEVARAEAKELELVNAIAATQKEVDDLEVVVAGMYTNAQIDKAISDAQTAATYNDTQVKADIKANADAIDAIEADYLKSADKTELANAIAAEKTRAEGVEGGLETRLAAVEADYLVEADKTELEGKITAEETARTEADNALSTRIKAVEDDYLKAADKTELEGKIKDAQDAADAAQDTIDAFLEAAEIGDAAVDTLKEIQAYIESDGKAADKMTKDIAANAEAIEAVEGRMDTAEGDIDALEGRMTTAEADIDAVEGRMTTAEGAITALQQAVGEGGSVDAQIDAKIADLDADVTSATVEEGKGIQVNVKEVDGKITEVVVTGNYDNAYDAKGSAAAAQTAAEETAAADATEKANKALEDAKTFTNEEVAKDRTRLEALETASATHATKTEVEAVSGRVTTLETDMAQAKTDITAIDGRVTANETAIGNIQTECATKATKTALQDEIDRATAKEAELAAAIGAFIECSESDITDLFA